MVLQKAVEARSSGLDRQLLEDGDRMPADLKQVRDPRLVGGQCQVGVRRPRRTAVHSIWKDRLGIES